VVGQSTIRVECYSGYRGEETPRTLWIGNRRIAVTEIIDQWLAPDHRYFKLRGDDQCLYIIRHDLVTFQWQMTLYQDRGMPNDSTPGPHCGNA
jgi:hypothetical protein